MHEMYNEATDRPPHQELCPLLFSTSVNKTNHTIHLISDLARG